MEDEEESNNQIKDIKIILLGDTGVGKTTIINRYINNEFTEENLVTLGSSFATKEVKKIKLIID
jgi:Ras-related protein Rab-7A